MQDFWVAIILGVHYYLFQFAVSFILSSVSSSSSATIAMPSFMVCKSHHDVSQIENEFLGNSSDLHTTARYNRETTRQDKLFSYHEAFVSNSSNKFVTCLCGTLQNKPFPSRVLQVEEYLTIYSDNLLSSKCQHTHVPGLSTSQNAFAEELKM